MNGIIDGFLALLDFDLRRATDPDHGNPAR
jgi:hypothetical protein